MTEPMRVLVTGAGGQLGRALRRTVPTGTACIALDHAGLDITSARAIGVVLDRYAPQAIINAAAYTAVDRAEQDVAAAVALNTTAPGLLAQAASARGIRLLHVSTDFVFDGQSSRPYLPTDPTAPLNVYGRTKLAGEYAVQAAQPEALILRTAWVYSADGSNFVKTMLRLINTRDKVGVVVDQVGTPTAADGLAQALWRALELKITGTYHWTDAGVASWYDFAVAIAEEATTLELLVKHPCICPIHTVDYPTPACRPAFSVLNKSASYMTLGITPLHWRIALRAELLKLKNKPKFSFT